MHSATERNLHLRNWSFSFRIKYLILLLVYCSTKPKPKILPRRFLFRFTDPYKILKEIRFYLPGSRITITKSLDHLRSKKRKKRFGFLSSLFGDDNKPVYEAKDFNHPGILQERKEDAAILFKLIDQLPENQRTAFILNKVEELSYREIAAVLDTTESAVDSLLQRAKQNLRKKINNLPP